MKTKRMMAQILPGTMFLLAGVALAAELANSPDATDWPQWRGPTRNGVAPAGPKLVDAWPKDGPPLLWKSEFIPGYLDGGHGSVVVAGGKAFAYVSWGSPVTATTTKRLNELGWIEGVPDELAKTVEAARTSPDRTKVKAETEIETYIKEFTAKLEPQQAEKYADFIKKRLGKDLGKQASGRVYDWGTLVRFSTMRDTEFPTFDSIVEAWGLGDGWHVDNNTFNDFGVGANRHWSDTVICLDVATGKTLWRKDFPTSWPNGWPGSSTPAVSGDKVYAVGNAGLYCLTVKDGAVVWQVPKKTKINSSPLVANGAVYITEPDLTAYDAQTGRVLWKTSVGGGGYDGPNFSVAPWTSGGKSYLVGVGEWGLYCVQPDTGKLLWQVRDCAVGEGSSTPAISGDLVAFRGGFDWLFQITPQGARQLWKTPTWVSRSGSSCIYRDCVYSIAQDLRCLDLKTGELKWSVPGAGQYGSPIAADGKIICPFGGRDYFYMVMQKAAPEKYQELGNFGQSPFPYHHIVCSCSSPALAGGKLFLRGLKAVLCYEIAEHRPYMEKLTAKGNELVCTIQQAEGGLKAEGGAIQGLTVTDAQGAAKPAKARLEKNTLVVDVKDAIFPVTFAYESGNLSAKNGPLAPFHWQSPRMAFKRCDGRMLTLDFRGEQGPDPQMWNNAKNYEIAGAKVTGVDASRWTIRLTTDKEWKMSDKLLLRYPAVPGESSIRKLELSDSGLLAHPVGNKPVQEFLFGEMRTGADAPDIEKTMLAETNQDKNIKPGAGGPWKIYRILPEAEVFGLCGYFGPGLSRKVIPACVYVYAEQARKIQLWYKDKDGIGMQIVVNGKVVVTDGNEHPDYNKLKDVELKEGWNTVLLTLATTRDWTPWFGLRICDEQGNAPASLWYTAEKPVEK